MKYLITIQIKTTSGECTEPSSKMKCNTLKCLLIRQTKKGAANEIIQTNNLRGKGKNGRTFAIEDLNIGDCKSLGTS